jgi:hypothetical protein
MRGLEWLGAPEAEKEIRRALKIPSETEIEVHHANFAKIKTQKFFAEFDSQAVKANFFADPKIAEKEALILDYLNAIKGEALDDVFVPPKKLYHHGGLVIREKTPGRILKTYECSDETLVVLAKILLAFKEEPVAARLQKHRLNFPQMKQRALKQIPRAVEAFTPFKGSREAFGDLEEILSRDWRGKFGRLSRSLVHGDFQPANILLSDGKVSLIDFDRGGYFYPLFDVVSFAVQFTHTALLESYQRGERADRREIRRRVNRFVREYRQGACDYDEEVFRLFKLLVIFDGLAFSTAGFRKKVTRGRKHLLFGLFRQELKWFANQTHPTGVLKQ